MRWRITKGQSANVSGNSKKKNCTRFWRRKLREKGKEQATRESTHAQRFQRESKAIKLETGDCSDGRVSTGV